MADTNPPRKSLSAFLIVVSVTSLILLLLGIALLLGAWHLEESNPFAMNWLVNLGAGFIGMAAATVVATLTGWVLARKKLKDLALPILKADPRIAIQGKDLAGGGKTSCCLCSNFNARRERHLGQTTAKRFCTTELSGMFSESRSGLRSEEALFLLPHSRRYLESRGAN